jgi:hypothetical protein
LFFVDEAGERIRLLREDQVRQWATDDILDIVAAEPGQQITEFDVYLPAILSQSNYLAYILDGCVYLSFANFSALEEWKTPELVDDAGDCRQLKIIRIGSDEEYNFNLFATYISDDDQGVPRLNFRDLRQLH